MEKRIFRISKNPARAKSLFLMAKDRLPDIKEQKKPYKKVEEYYEIIKELITGIMYFDGFKTLSHISLLEYIKEEYLEEITKQELNIIDILRKLRNDILYYGQKIDQSFLDNYEENIKQIINKLIIILSKKLN